MRQFAKLCDVRDWDDAEVLRVLREILLRVLREILPERDPATHVERKVWEFAMLALFLEQTGRMNEQTEAFAVGAGDERIVFWLANRLGRVVATHLELMQPLDLMLPASSRVNVTRTDSDGLHPESGEYWPHVILKAGRSLFTSVALPLRKPI